MKELWILHIAGDGSEKICILDESNMEELCGAYPRREDFRGFCLPSEEPVALIAVEVTGWEFGNEYGLPTGRICRVEY